MIIKRDILVHSPSIAAAMMQAQAAAARQAQASPNNAASPIQLSPSPKSSQPGNYTFSPAGSSAAGGSGYALNPLQQRDAMQREQKEKERRALLQKASNSQGSVVEKLLATYLAV